MHVGSPSVPTIKPKQEVLRGQCIAEPETGKLGARIHSSVSGVVDSVTNEFIVISENGNQSTDFEKIKKCKSVKESVYEAGVVGAGGAGFPTHVKLGAVLKEGYLIANGVECEPGLEHNIERLEQDPTETLKGIKYAMDAVGATKGIIGIKEKHGKAVDIVNQYISKLNFSEIMKVHTVKDIYPMGEERALIHSIFGKWIDPTNLPSSLNCLVLNVETLVNITKAVEIGKPVIDKDFTIVGDFLDKNYSTVLLDVPIGSSIKTVLTGFKPVYEIGEYIVGGPHTGVSSNIEDAYITKMSGGVIVTIPLPEYKGPVGLLVCACGANEERLRDIASKMHAEVKGVAFCKNIAENGKCQTPGTCPGQAQVIMKLKSEGAKRVIIANCHDCSNTVMCSAPKLGIGVYHSTDHVMRTIDQTLIRRMPID